MDLSDSELIERCKNGDHDAWKTLIDKYTKRIFNIVYQFTSNFEDSEDLTQEIFLKVYNSLKKFDSGTSFLPWLIRIAKNYCIDDYRVRRKTKMVKDGEQILNVQHDYTYNPFRSLLDKERAAFIMKGMNSLAEDLRAVLVLRDFQGFNYAEIAEVLQVPEGTVKSRINRARIELAEALKKIKGFKTIL